MGLLLLVSCERVWVHLCLLEVLLCKELVNAGSVLRALNLWFVWHFVRFGLNSFPINVVEELVFLKI